MRNNDKKMSTASIRDKKDIGKGKKQQGNDTKTGEKMPNAIPDGLQVALRQFVSATVFLSHYFNFARLLLIVPPSRLLNLISPSKFTPLHELTHHFVRNGRCNLASLCGSE